MLQWCLLVFHKLCSLMILVFPCLLLDISTDNTGCFPRPLQDGHLQLDLYPLVNDIACHCRHSNLSLNPWKPNSKSGQGLLMLMFCYLRWNFALEHKFWMIIVAIKWIYQTTEQLRCWIIQQGLMNKYKCNTYNCPPILWSGGKLYFLVLKIIWSVALGFYEPRSSQI